MRATPPRVADIARSFLHLGLTAFGGLAMVEPMRRLVVTRQGWLNQEEFLDGLALCQLVPGATMVQLATYVGFRLKRLAGAGAAAGAFILPAFLLMAILSTLYFHFGELSWIRSISRGLAAVVIALLLQTIWGLGENLWIWKVDLVLAVPALGAFLLGANYWLVFLALGLLRCFLPSPGEPPPGRPSRGIPAKERAALVRQSVTPAVLLVLSLLLGCWWARHSLWGQLAWLFLKIGVISFGGGYVMIPILEWETVHHLGWLTQRQFLDGLLLGYATPGPLLILATFVGYARQGLLGGAMATVAVFLPPILIIICLSPGYDRLKEARLMRRFIRGILAALVGFLVLVTGQMSLAALSGGKELALMTGAVVALMVFRVSLLWVIAAAAVLSLVIF